MEDSFGINNVALVDGRPLTLGLRDLLGVYLAHRITVTRRRTTTRLGKRKARLHLVEGLLIAIVSIDEVIQVIRSSEEVDDARRRLREVFELSELQAEYILELRLRRLTKFSKIELESEKETLLAEIAALEHILANEVNLRAVVSAELAEVAEKYGDERRTTLIAEVEEVKPISMAKAASVNAELADTPCTIVLTSSGMLARVEGHSAVTHSSKRSKHDAICLTIQTSTRQDIGFVTTHGKVHRIHSADVPNFGESFDASQSVSAHEFLGLPKEERILTVFEINDSAELALGTEQGVVKRVIADFPAKDEFEVITLKDGDKVIGAALAKDSSTLIFAASDAQLLHYQASSVRPQGRPAGGVAGINLGEGARVVFFGAVESVDSAVVVTAANSSLAIPGTDAGSLKISDLSEFPAKGRATGGVRSQRFVRGEDQLYFAWAGVDSIFALTADGKPIDLRGEKAKRDASGTPQTAVIGSIGN
jgi:DNA gyrase subunit A